MCHIAITLFAEPSWRVFCMSKAIAKTSPASLFIFEAAGLNQMHLHDAPAPGGQQCFISSDMLCCRDGKF